MKKKPEELRGQSVTKKVQVLSQTVQLELSYPFAQLVVLSSQCVLCEIS